MPLAIIALRSEERRFCLHMAHWAYILLEKNITKRIFARDFIIHVETNIHKHPLQRHIATGEKSNVPIFYGCYTPLPMPI